MKKIFTLSILTLALLCKLGAQENHLIIFSEDLNPFYAYVNGVKQNVEPHQCKSHWPCASVIPIKSSSR